MNNQRRKQIEEIAKDLEALAERIEDVMNDEQNYFDAMPESFQSGTKGEAAEQALYALEGAKDAIENAKDNLEEASS